MKTIYRKRNLANPGFVLPRKPLPNAKGDRAEDHA